MISCRGHKKGHYLMTNVWAIQANIFFVLPQEISMIIAVEQLIPLQNVIISRSCMISLSSTLGKEIARPMKALQCEAEHGSYSSCKVVFFVKSLLIAKQCREVICKQEIVIEQEKLSATKDC